ncbi:uncharacterized protein EMH_0010040 [Eimeria mitis]|uniref:Transmembrane protein n=1 Tax=Eimeria mitis TaxID=44415 RepID=U6KE19_9EIME|nr:uncharacterized protein EMH_0010040 [Eimeria mitis]CDJ36194.1 hypothetical protein, conserved [Eimeria mitis]
MSSRYCERRCYLALLYLVTVVIIPGEANAAYPELTSTDDVHLLELSQASEDYSIRNTKDTNSIIGDLDTPFKISEGAASPYPEHPLPFHADTQISPRQKGLVEQASPQRTPEGGTRSVVITEAYLVGHLPEKLHRPPDRVFWIQKLLALGLLLTWTLIGHRAASDGASDGLSRALLALWTVSLLMSLLRRTPEPSHFIVASAGVAGQSQAAGRGKGKSSSLRKFFANVLTVMLTLIVIALFGPLIFFVTGVLLAAMLAAVLGIAICLSR